MEQPRLTRIFVMITFEKDEPSFSDANYRVATAGEYQPEDHVEIYSVFNPEGITTLPALFIKEGIYPE